MVEPRSVEQALRDCGLVEAGVEEIFDRLARLTVRAAHVPACVVAFGAAPNVRVKGYAGPPSQDPDAVVPLALHDVLMSGRRTIVAQGGAAGCAVSTDAGLVVGGLWVRSDAAPTWTDDVLDVLETGARLLRAELSRRLRRRPDETTSQILESISDACVFLDSEWRYTYVNRKAGEIFAREPSSLIGKHIWTEFPEGVGQPFYHAYHRALSEQTTGRIEAYYPPWDRWFENRIYPSKDGLAIFFQDVTERRQAEMEKQKVADEHRREREVRKKAEQMAHLGFWVWDIARNHVSWSDELCRIYGIEADQAEASFESYLDRVHPQDRKRVRDMIEQALRDERPMSFEERIVRPDGQVRWLRSWGNVSVDADGQPTEMFGTCVDITDIRIATEELQRKEAWLGAALSATRIALWEWEVKDNRVQWSAGAESALGIGAGALGSSFDAYLGWVHAEDREGVLEALRASVKTTATLHLPHRLVSPDGTTRWVVARGHVVQDASARPTRVLGTIVDVTQLHDAEDEQRRLLERLRHAQKIAAIGELSASIAHDLNNLLAIVSTANQVLDREAALSAAGRQAVTNVGEAYQRGAALTAQLLAVGRKQDRAVEAIDLNVVIERACGLYRGLLPASVDLRLELLPGLAPVMGERGQLEQVLLNLVVNARDAMPEGGTLTISTEAGSDGALLTITDTGVGMTPEVRGRIFEPFYTTKRDQGTGLGLAIVHGIVQKSNGDVEVESEPGRGCRFTVRLPYA